MTSNKLTARRSSPGTPKVCKSKKIIPIPPPWPPDKPTLLWCAYYVLRSSPPLYEQSLQFKLDRLTLPGNYHAIHDTPNTHNEIWVQVADDWLSAQTHCVGSESIGGWTWDVTTPYTFPVPSMNMAHCIKTASDPYRNMIANWLPYVW
jgi:hypothetical protein